MFDLDLLPTFAVFADTLSFTATGERCGLTQPAVHGQIKRLAEQLGTPLYHREGRSLVLTPRGVQLAALARDVQSSAQAFLGHTEPLRIAAGRGAWQHLLLPLRGEWLRAHPFVPRVADGPTSARLVLEGHADLGISTDPPATTRQRLIFRVGTHALVPPDHPLAQRPSIALADLAASPWILPSPGRAHRVILEAMLRKQGLAPAIATTCDDWMLTAGFVALGLGVAVVNDFVTHPGAVAVPLSDGPVQAYQLFWRRPSLDPTAASLVDPNLQV